MSPPVKHRRKGFTRLSRKNQATIPVDVVSAAGLCPGDVLRAEATAPGRVLLTRAEDPLEALAGALTGVFEPGFLSDLRDEWD
jgi:bifunctional DNA-binding transcriptional regulator/antitoxin component of YhaV-PrlF toxin-antitoxin module